MYRLAKLLLVLGAEYISAQIYHMVVIKNVIFVFAHSTLYLQSLLQKARDELEAEKRELVRTLERRSQEVEHQSGEIHLLHGCTLTQFHRLLNCEDLCVNS